MARSHRCPAVPQAAALQVHGRPPMPTHAVFESDGLWEVLILMRNAFVLGHALILCI